jgi:hypothetical protein
MGAVRYTRGQRQLARDFKQPLFALAINRQYVQLPDGKRGGVIEMSGVGDEALVTDILNLIKKYAGRRKKKGNAIR